MREEVCGPSPFGKPRPSVKRRAALGSDWAARVWLRPRLGPTTGGKASAQNEKPRKRLNAWEHHRPLNGATVREPKQVYSKGRSAEERTSALHRETVGQRLRRAPDPACKKDMPGRSNEQETRHRRG
ncbi:hypothetical protein NDU88_000673 [Pleurodeles waltl]|uniref:Uncharacterized protein n=1 Tax=Pleurodeles waltl TaxID=8319 RepID=A0AAV7UUQ8_PLEWA|nr:hypothetical protein NDU88_000673 [Pleurodeles waltl]